MNLAQTNFLAFDVGDKRIGLALVLKGSFIVKPLNFLPLNSEFDQKLKEIITSYEIERLVVGLPRNQEGQLTQQSQKVKRFVQDHLQVYGLKIDYQDESLTSVLAADNLRFKQIKKGQIDSEAACLILEDYINNLS
jgi:putative Holliday junction resolvase